LPPGSLLVVGGDAAGDVLRIEEPLAGGRAVANRLVGLVQFVLEDLGLLRVGVAGLDELLPFRLEG
jgi:hypothetical protein